VRRACGRIAAVKILIGTRGLVAHGGSQSYVETAVAELRQLGHRVVVYSPNLGHVAGRLRSTGVEVVGSLDDVGAVDVAHVQHASTAFSVRARFPRLPMVYVCHSSVLDIEDPPALAAPQIVVVLSNLVARRLAASAVAGSTEIVRLRQPVALAFREDGMVPIRDSPRRAVYAGRRSPAFETFLGSVCSQLGVELEWIGGTSDSVDDLTPAFMRSDIVFAVGRTLLEAMALGRAGFVLDERGSGGFVTQESYQGIEDGAFAAFDPKPMTERSLVDDLRGYDVSIGRIGYELVRTHHSARSHARDLVETYSAAIEADPPADVDTADLLRALGDSSERRFQLENVGRLRAWRSAATEHWLDEARQRVAAVEDELRALRADGSTKRLRPLRLLYSRLRARS
jgi:hypothetical protein